MDPFVRDLQVAGNDKRQTGWYTYIKAFGTNHPFGSPRQNTNNFFLSVTKCFLIARVRISAFPEVIVHGSSHSPIHSKEHTVVGTGCHSERIAGFVCSSFFLTYTVCMIVS